MNFLGMGPGELMVILILALIVFGPQKLPQIGREVGKAIGEFRRATSEITNEINRELSMDAPPPKSPQAEPPATAEPRPAEPPTGQSGDSPLVLEIKPSARQAVSNGVDVSTPPVEVAPESPAAHPPLDGEIPEEMPAGVVAEGPAKPARVRRARKTAEPAEPASDGESAEPAPRPRRRRKTEAAPTETEG